MRCVRRLAGLRMWSSLKKWVDNNADHRRLVTMCRRIGARLRELSLARAFDKWAGEAQESMEEEKRMSVKHQSLAKDEREKQKKIGQIMLSNTSQAWLLWLTNIKYHRRVRALEKRGVCRLMNRVQARALSCWQ